MAGGEGFAGEGGDEIGAAEAEDGTGLIEAGKGGAGLRVGFFCFGEEGIESGVGEGGPPVAGGWWMPNG